jgi:phosphoglycerate dehydrogenase-like enzyme
LEGRDIVIDSCAPAIGEAVAEFTLACLIMGLKNQHENATANRKGKAGKPKQSKILMESVIGIIGASQVGRRVIRNLSHFDPAILVYDPYLSDDDAAQLGVEKMDSVKDMCARADAVSLHTPNLPDCKKILGRDEMAALRDGAVVVNTSRGPCLDEAALIEELKKGRLTAYLDVSDPEPAAEDSPLRSLPNCVYTSHIAGGPSWRIGRQVVDDVRAFLNDQPLTMAVSEEMLERLA